jgi:hypothetical protein
VTVIASGFSGSRPISCAQGRYGELIVAQGNGVQPKRWSGSGTATNAGIAAPAAAPAITLQTPARYYVARADVHKPGAVYNAPPAVTFTTLAAQPTGHVAAKATAYLNQSVVSEVRITNGGKNYTEPPSITLSDTHGKNAVLTAVLDGTPAPADAITQFEVIQGPPFDDETDYPLAYRTQWGTWGPVDIPISNGSGTITVTPSLYHNACGLGPTNLGSYYPVTLTLNYTVTGAGSGSGAVARVNFYGQKVYRTACVGSVSFVYYASSMFVRSVSVKAQGSGYDPNTAVTITIAPLAGGPTKNLIIEGYPTGHSKNTAAQRYSLKAITVSPTARGTGYVVAPEIKIVSSSGFGAYATCAVSKGEITSVTVENGGGGFKTVPVVQAVAGGAEAFAVARPHLRGKYQCYYRYVDNTLAANGGPIPSNLSPVLEVDAGEGARSMTWTVPAATNTDGRTLTVELWRTTGNQALMLYRVGTATSFVDDLTDEEVRNPDRAGYAAMPIVLPNGDLNAMRFTPPPNNKAVVVRFQDRFWYGVDTSGTESNSIYFSEVDEPESVPDINEFVLQQNARDADAITALIPFGSVMLIMQSRHAYSMSFSKQPLRDGDVTPLANRGCLNQRCWDIHEGLCYVLDQHGLYSITPQGEVKDLSAPIADVFRSRLKWDTPAWTFLLVDAAKKVVRAFVPFVADNPGDYPSRVLCYSIETNTWWIERYPHRISSGTNVPMNSGAHRSVYAGEGGLYLLDEGRSDAARGAIATVTITNKGAGYRSPPVVSAPGGVGGELQASLDAQGRLSGVWIIHPGYGFAGGSLYISPPDDPDCAAPVQATATFTATSTSVDTAIAPVYRYKTGNRSFPTDMTAKGGGTGQPRDISLTYKPQPSSCDVAVRLYYNNSQYPRPNVAARNRGTGFSSGVNDSATRLDMGALTSRTGYDSGVAKGSFANRSIDDIKSADRHVAVELLGARKNADPVVIYALDVYGTSNASGE